MFKELYYWMYVNLRKVKSNKNPAQNAYFFMSMLLGFNTNTIIIIINYFLKQDIGRNPAIYFGLVLTFVLLVVNYFLLYAKREVIFQKYEALPAERKIKGQIYFWLYVVLSVALLFGLGANLVTPKY
jgi:hypothetical protein